MILNINYEKICSHDRYVRKLAKTCISSSKSVNMLAKYKAYISNNIMFLIKINLLL